MYTLYFFFSSRRRHTRWPRDWSSDVCSSDLHAGAVYLHQGELYLVTALDLAEGVALVEPGDPGYLTSAREVTGIDVVSELRQAAWGPASVSFGEVDVVRQVTSFTRRNPETGQPLGEEALDLPPRALRTRAVWWTISDGQREELLRRGVDLAGAAHAAEHTAIGLLPLFAACDRMDIGGVSAVPPPAARPAPSQVPGEVAEPVPAAPTDPQV